MIALMLVLLAVSDESTGTMYGQTGYSGVADADLITYWNTTASVLGRGEKWTKSVIGKLQESSRFAAEEEPARGLAVSWGNGRRRPQTASFVRIGDQETVLELLNEPLDNESGVWKVTTPGQGHWVHAFHPMTSGFVKKDGRMVLDKVESERPLFRHHYRLANEILYHSSGSSILTSKLQSTPRPSGGTSAWIQVDGRKLPEVMLGRLTAMISAGVAVAQQRRDRESDAQWLFRYHWEAARLKIEQGLFLGLAGVRANVHSTERVDEFTGDIQVTELGHFGELPLAEKSRCHFDDVLASRAGVRLWIALKTNDAFRGYLRSLMPMLSDESVRHVVRAISQLNSAEICVRSMSDEQGFGLLTGIRSDNVERLAECVASLNLAPNWRFRRFDDILWLGWCSQPDSGLMLATIENREQAPSRPAGCLELRVDTRTLARELSTVRSDSMGRVFAECADVVTQLYGPDSGGEDCLRLVGRTSPSGQTLDLQFSSRSTFLRFVTCLWLQYVER